MQVYNSSAILKGFERPSCANVEGKKPVLETALCLVRNPSTEFRLARLFNRVVPYMGFFIAASDAKANAPEWVSCTGYTGHIAPYASLANLVKVLHNSPALSGITDRMRIRINPFSALSSILASKGYCGGKAYLFHMPLRELLSK